MKWGPISLRSCILVSTDSGKLMVIPVAMATPKEFICSPIQAKGRKERYSSVFVEFVDLGDLDAHVDVIFVAYHGTFGQPGRTGSQTEVTNIVRAWPGRLGHRILSGFSAWAACTHFIEIFDKKIPVVGPVIPHAARILVDHLVHLGNPVPHCPPACPPVPGRRKRRP